jgi:SAM-dependent methyltransferase
MLSPHDWHLRYLQQARWTLPLRQYLFQKADLPKAHAILEVGCGTGALLTELLGISQVTIHGLDINSQNLSQAVENAQGVRLTCGDAHKLPYCDSHFDIVFCHFLLLWVVNPRMVIHEMARVTRFGGAIIVAAEPDYGGRIDYPPELSSLGQGQAEALRRQGANPNIGRQLANLLIQSQLTEVETGVLGGQWKVPSPSGDWQGEWQMIQSDLQGAIPGEQLDALQVIDSQAWQSGERILYVPTFYAWGRKFE